MKRFASITCAFLLAAAGCGSTKSTGGGGDDASVVKVVDMAVAATPPDMTASGAPTGDPCTKNTECMDSKAGSSKKATCLKTDAQSGVVYPGGYCTSPCRPSMNDAISGLNPDCPSDTATCLAVSQTAGECVVQCAAAATDCRSAEGYVCVNDINPFGSSCQPKGKTWCDPTKPTSCAAAADGNAQICTDFSPDQSNGECTEICDVFAQNCPMQNMAQLGCIADSKGQQSCLFNSGIMADTACHYLNDCAPGLACHTKANSNMPLCQPYCRVGSGSDGGTVSDGGIPTGDVACPAMHQCVDLKTGKTAAVIALGICEPL